MKVTLINTTDAGGGAPQACTRLLKALESKLINVRMLVQQKKTDEPRVISIEKNAVDRLRSRFNFYYERLPFIAFQAKDKSVRFAFSTADTGTNIAHEAVILDADVLHLHWTNFGFLSIDDLKELIELKKPIVWTLHDMWAFTGGCHYAGTCDHFIRECGNCYFLRNPNTNDLSHQVWKQKLDLLSGAKNIVFITCSNWLATVARKSSLLGTFRIEAIPNPIDATIFAPKNKLPIRKKWNIDPDKKIILFGAANILDRRKGFSYLVEALHHLKNNYQHAIAIEIVIFGKNKHFDVDQLPFPVHQLGLIANQEDMAALYSMADVLVSPSVEDNLPNIIMEALACGTPVVAFDTGGIPDMVDHHQNGYLATFKSSEDLAAGIQAILFSDREEALAVAARNKVLDNFSNEKVAAQYIDVYQSIINP